MLNLYYFQNGQSCVAQDLLEVYVQSEHELIEEEVKTFQEISNDEWNLLRETPTERVANIMNRMKNRLRKVKQFQLFVYDFEN